MLKSEIILLHLQLGPWSDHPVLSELAEHPAVGRSAEHPVAHVFAKLRLAVVDRPFPSNPSQPFIVGRIHDEQLVEFRNGTAYLPMVVGFAPVGKTLP